MKFRFCIPIVLSFAVSSSASAAGSCDWPTRPALATVTSITGDLSARTGDGDWCDAVVGLKLIANDEMHTGPDSIAVVTFFDKSFITVYQNAETAIGDLSGAVNRPKIRVLLKMGEVAAKVNHDVDVAADFAIRTPNLTASVRGTKFVIAYDPNAGTTVIRVDEGKVEVTPENPDFKSVVVPAPGIASVSSEGVKVENVQIP